MSAGGETRSAAAFDEVAATYDEWFEQSAITRSIRGIVHRSCAKYFHAGDRVLELNCGTGSDALYLTGIGVRVRATDASPSMIAMAGSKLAREIGSGRAEVGVMDVDDLAPLGDATFDGAFSNFGGLNCAREPERVVRGVAAHMRPGGIFIACLMNRNCAWEMMSFLVRGKIAEAARRRRQVEVKLGRASVRVTYYTPRTFSRLLADDFTVEETYGLNILSPGPNSRSFAANFPGVTKFLLGADGLVRRLPPFPGLGDHFVVVARRKTP